MRCDVATWRKRPLRPRPAPSSLRPRPRPTPNEQHKWAHRSAVLTCAAAPPSPQATASPRSATFPIILCEDRSEEEKSRLRQGERITTHPHAHTSASPTPPHIPSHPPRPLTKRFLTSGPASAGVGRTVSLWLPSERGAARRRPSEAVKTNAHFHCWRIFLFIQKCSLFAYYCTAVYTCTGTAACVQAPAGFHLKFLFASRNAPRAPWMRDSGIRGRAGGEIMHSTPRGHIFLKSHMHRGAGGGRCRRLTLLIRRPAGRCRPRPRSSVRPTPDLAPADWRLCTGARRDGCCTPRLDARS